MALKAQRRSSCHRLFLQQANEGYTRRSGSSHRKPENAKELSWITRAAETRQIPIEYVSRHDLNLMCDDRPHQGVMLDCSPLSFPLLDTLPAPTQLELPHLWVVLDGITDPQNLGAVLRSCFFFKVCGVIIPERNSAPISAVAIKASAGAAEMMQIVYCSQVNQVSGFIILTLFCV
jgi:21S rRNA (GM2251-2'-O)-methyltransferase